MRSTNADFYYMDKDNIPRWIGSVETGYPATPGIKSLGIPPSILKCTKKATFKKSIKRLIRKRKKDQWRYGRAWDKSDGWPWTWDNSSHTDYSYWFFEKQVWMVENNYFFPASLYPPKVANYPRMTSK